MKKAVQGQGVAGKAQETDSSQDTKRYYRDGELYDWLAHRWGLDVVFHRLRERRCRALIESYGAGGQVLDVGCGTGLITRHLQGHLVMGLDISRWKLERAVQHAPRMAPVWGDAENLPIRSNSLDLVVCTETLEHLPHPQKAVAELYRILKPGGLLIGSVPTQSWIWKWRRVIPSSCPASEPFHHNYSRQQLAIMLASPGVELLHFSQHTLGLDHLFAVRNLPSADGEPTGTASSLTGLSVTVATPTGPPLDSLKDASGDWILVMAELTVPPGVVDAMEQQAKAGADLVVACFLYQGKGVGRKVWDWVAIALTKLLLPRAKAVRDPFSGLFLVRKRVVEGLPLGQPRPRLLLDVLARGKYRRVAEVSCPISPGPAPAPSPPGGESLPRQVLRLLHEIGEDKRLVKFAGVGGSGVALAEGILWGLTEGLGLPYLVSGAIGAELTIIYVFILNDLLTFSDLRASFWSGLWQRGLKFNLARGLSLGVDVGVLFLLTQFLGWHYLLSYLVAIGVGTLLNYIISRHWVW